jgi:hypothetical protein
MTEFAILQIPTTGQTVSIPLPRENSRYIKFDVTVSSDGRLMDCHVSAMDTIEATERERINLRLDALEQKPDLGDCGKTTPIDPTKPMSLEDVLTNLVERVLRIERWIT